MCYPVVVDFARPIADLMNQLRSCSTGWLLSGFQRIHS